MRDDTWLEAVTNRFSHLAKPPDRYFGALDLTADTSSVMDAMEPYSFMDAMEPYIRADARIKGAERERELRDFLERAKTITEVTVNHSYPFVTQGDDSSQLASRGPVEVTITDQHGRQVPHELHEQLLNLDDPSQFQATLEAWNASTCPPHPEHRAGCIYNGGWACTCQPPTLFGETLLYLCACCDQPRAEGKFRLCDMCEAHQHTDPRQADIDHEVARLA